MAYVDQRRQANRPAAIAGVIAIHAALGYAVVTGLAPKIGEIFVPPRLEGTNIVVDLPPPPPPEPKAKEQPKPNSDPIIFAPTPPVNLTPSEPKFDTSNVLPPLDDGPIVDLTPPSTGGTGSGIVEQPPLPPAFDPVRAKPRNDPSQWVTTSDYKSSWVNREYEGTARFRLSISATGKVDDCQITSSTGHSALDAATCRLIKRRAKFNPAKDSTGAKVQGNFTSSVRWQLPD